MKKPTPQPSMESRFDDYLEQGESAAMYLHGLADAWEAAWADKAKGLVHRLRCHAHELNGGRLWVRDGYKESEAGGGE